jgi:phytoene dehydrogenase-like protein
MRSPCVFVAIDGDIAETAAAETHPARPLSRRFSGGGAGAVEGGIGDPCRWLDAFQAALDRDYPGSNAAVVERMFLNARSMHNFVNTPAGATYGFAPLPFERGIWAGQPRTPRTPLPGVYPASSFAGSGGFTGAIMGGADAARMAMREQEGGRRAASAGLAPPPALC